MRTSITLLVTLACTLASACGDSGPGDVDSGLPPEKKVSELSASEQTTLCEAATENLAARNSTDELKRFGCILGSAFGGGDDPVAFCESFLPMCLDAPEQEGQEPGPCTLAIVVETCQATISDFEACLTEQNETTSAAISDASCADLGKEPVTPVAGPACSKIKTTCPGVG
jgi:hypothetical protein